MVYAPIWKDTYYTAATSTLVYSITLNGQTIFNGKAYRLPNENVLKLNINKICQDYLGQDVDSLFGSSSSQTNHTACLDFVLKNSSNTTLETYRFLYCWDYDYNWNNNAVTLSESINGHYTSGQWKLATSVSTGNSSNINVVTTSRNNSTLYTKEVCADYILHFVGARGGWMSFAFEGKCVKTDAITHHYFNKAFNNTTREFEQGKYISEITPSYKLTTSFLTEAESLKFAKNVISTPKAYLQILSEGKIIPVIITNNSAEYKIEDGQNLISYEVTAKESQTKLKK